MYNAALKSNGMNSCEDTVPCGVHQQYGGEKIRGWGLISANTNIDFLTLFKITRILLEKNQRLNRYTVFKVQTQTKTKKRWRTRCYAAFPWAIHQWAWGRMTRCHPLLLSPHSHGHATNGNIAIEKSEYQLCGKNATRKTGMVIFRGFTTSTLFITSPLKHRLSLPVHTAHRSVEWNHSHSVCLFICNILRCCSPVWNRLHPKWIHYLLHSCWVPLATAWQWQGIILWHSRLFWLRFR